MILVRAHQDIETVLASPVTALLNSLTEEVKTVGGIQTSIGRTTSAMLLRWWSLATATATTESATELRSELSRCTALLALAGVTATVLASVTSVTATATEATATTSPLATALLAGKHTAWWSVRALLLDVGLRNDLSWEVEPLAEVVETLWSEGVVVPLPGELGLEVTAGGQRLASLDDLLCRVRY